MTKMSNFAPIGAILVFLIFVCFVFSGCGSGRPARSEVSGKVTLDNGPWPKAGTLHFNPVESDDNSLIRPGEAPFDSEGNYRAGTWEKGDGLLPGKYRVGIECWIVPPSMGGPPAISAVPSKYRNASTSGLELKIEPGERNKTFDFNVPQNK